VELEVELEEAVLAGQELVLGGDPPLGLDRALHDLQVGVPRVPGGEQRHLRLEQPPGLEHAADLADPQVALAPQDLARDHAVEHHGPAARAGADLQDAGLGQELERLAHRRPRDLHLLGQRALRRQLVARVQVPERDALGDLRHGLLEGAARLHGGERELGHRRGAVSQRGARRVRAGPPGPSTAVLRRASAGR
jgi:hypothetical protein